MNKHRLFIIWFVLMFILTSFSTFILFFYILLPINKKNFQSHSIERTKIIAQNRASQFINTLETNDDIGTIKTIKEIMNEPDILYVRIISTDGVILAHNSISESSKKINDYAGKLLLNSKKELLIKSDVPAEYDFSIPLIIYGNHTANLSIGFSIKGIAVKLGKIKKFYHVLFLFFSLFLTISIMLLFYFLILKRLHNLKLFLENVLTGSSIERIPDTVKDEIGSPAEVMNQILDKKFSR